MDSCYRNCAIVFVNFVPAIWRNLLKRACLSSSSCSLHSLCKHHRLITYISSNFWASHWTEDRTKFACFLNFTFPLKGTYCHMLEASSGSKGASLLLLGGASFLTPFCSGEISSYSTNESSNSSEGSNSEGVSESSSKIFVWISVHCPASALVGYRDKKINLVVCLQKIETRLWGLVLVGQSQQELSWGD